MARRLRRRTPDLPLALLLLLILLVSPAAVRASTEPTITPGPGATQRATWNFSSPSAYLANNLTLAPGRVTLQGRTGTFTLLGTTSLLQGTRWNNVNATRGPGVEIDQLPQAPIIATIQPASSDTHLDESRPFINYGSSANMFVDGSPGARERSLVAFSLASLPGDARVLLARTHLNVQGSVGKAILIEAHRVNASWTQGGASWNQRDGTNYWNRPGGDYDGAILDSQNVSTAGDYSWNVTSAVQTWVDNPALNYGFIFATTDSGLNNTKTIQSSEAAPLSTTPKLEVTYYRGGTLTTQPGPLQTRDTTLDRGVPGRNQGNGSYLQVSGPGPTETRALVAIDPVAVPAGTVVTKVRLWLYQTGGNATAVAVHGLTASWTEGTGAFVADGATWNTRDGSAPWGSAGGDFLPGESDVNTTSGPGQWTAWDITGLAQGWMAGKMAKAGVILHPEGDPPGSQANFASSDHPTASLRPRLTVEYSGGGDWTGTYLTTPLETRGANWTRLMWSWHNRSLADDEFGGPLLPQWSWSNPPDTLGGSYDVNATTPGNLHVVSEPSTQFNNGSSNGNFLGQSIQGNFELATRVQATVSNAGAQAGIIAQRSSGDWFIAFRSSAGFFGWGATGGIRTEVGSTSAPDNPFYLKLTRGGNTFQGWESANGATWRSLGVYTPASAWPSILRVGLFVADPTAGNQIADFDYAHFTFPGATTAEVRIRTGNTSDPNLGLWTAWSAPHAAGASPLGILGKEIQMKVTLTTANPAVVPVWEGATLDYYNYTSIGTLETFDYFPTLLGRWGYLTYQGSGTAPQFWYSIDSGLRWYQLPAGGDLGAVSTATGHIRIRAILSSSDTGITPVLNSITLETSDPLDHFYVSVPSVSKTLTAFPLTVQAKSASNVTIRGWIGTLALRPVALDGYPALGVLSVTVANITQNGTVTVTTETYDRPDRIHIEVSSQGIIGRSGVLWTIVGRPPRFLGVIPAQRGLENSIFPDLNLSSYVDDPDGGANGGRVNLRWYVAGARHEGITGANQTGQLVMGITPLRNQYGNDSLTLWVVDTLGNENYTTFWINVTHVNQPPRIQPIPPFTVHYDVAYYYWFFNYVSDVDNPLSDLRLTIQDPNDPLRQYTQVNGLNVSFTYPKSFEGRAVFPSVTISDGNASTTTLLQITVTNDGVPDLVKPLPDVALRQGEFRRNVFDLDDYFSDPDRDSLFYATGYSHVNITINADHTVDVRAGLFWSGVEYVTFRAIDPRNARAEDFIVVQVLPIDQPPRIKAFPDLVVRYSTSYPFDLTPYISDPDDGPGALRVTTANRHAIVQGLRLILYYDFSENNLVDVVTLTVSDATTTLSRDLRVRVQDLAPPTVPPWMPDSQLAEDTPAQYPYALSNYFFSIRGLHFLTFTDNDNVTATVFNFDRVELRPAPNWNSFEGSVRGPVYPLLTFRAVDNSTAALGELSVHLTVTAVPDAPAFKGLPAEFNVTVGEESVLDFSPYLVDVDSNVSLLTVTADDNHIQGIGTNLVLHYPYDYLTPTRTSVTINVTVRDETGLATTAPVTLRLQRVSQPITFPLFVAAIVAGLAAASGILGTIYLLREGPFVLHDAMVVTTGGMLLLRYGKKQATEVDEDIFTGVLTVIMRFVEEAMKGRSYGLRRFDLGAHKVMIQKGKSLYVALIHDGALPRRLPKRLSLLIESLDILQGSAERGVVEFNDPASLSLLSNFVEGYRHVRRKEALEGST